MHLNINIFFSIKTNRFKHNLTFCCSHKVENFFYIYFLNNLHEFILNFSCCWAEMQNNHFIFLSRVSDFIDHWCFFWSFQIFLVLWQSSRWNSLERHFNPVNVTIMHVKDITISEIELGLILVYFCEIK